MLNDLIHHLSPDTLVTPTLPHIPAYAYIGSKHIYIIWMKKYKDIEEGRRARGRGREVGRMGK